jgi:hypothetical protein
MSILQKARSSLNLACPDTPLLVFRWFHDIVLQILCAIARFNSDPEFYRKASSKHS